MKKLLSIILAIVAGMGPGWAQSDPPYPTAPPAVLNIVAAEYAIDSDPGFGNGIAISITPATDISSVLSAVNVSSLSVGAHVIFFRTRNAEGSWSITSTKQFFIDFDPPYPPVPSSLQQIVRVEYSIDGNPVFGSGTDAVITPATDISGATAVVNTSLLTAGSHRLYLRALNGEGEWSIISSKAFVIDENPAYPAAPPTVSSISEAEYFFDTDPGVGNGTRFTFPAGVDVSNFNLAIPTAGLSVGAHQLYIRTLNPVSLTSIVPFNAVSGLPLSLLSFKAVVRNNQTQLEAVTTDEVNTDRIELERSRDAVQFNRLGSLPTHNTLGKHRYEFIDPLPLNGINYYRLKLVDIGEKFTYSRILSVNANASGKLVLSPNPVRNQLQVSLPRTGAATLSIYNSNGQVIYQRSVTANSNLLLLDLSSLAKGMYWLKLGDSKEVWTQPFVKE